MNHSPDKEQLLLYDAVGFSMWPFLKGKEKLIVRSVVPAELIAGDMILYRAGEQVICHRFMRQKKEAGQQVLYARADTSMAACELVKEGALVGKVIARIRGTRIMYFDSWGQKKIKRLMRGVSFCIGLLLKINNARKPHV